VLPDDDVDDFNGDDEAMAETMRVEQEIFLDTHTKKSVLRLVLLLRLVVGSNHIQ